MNKDQVKGKLQNLKGRAKEALGALTGRKTTQAEGFAERTVGAESIPGPAEYVMVRKPPHPQSK